MGDQQEVSRWLVVTEAAQVQEPLQGPGSHRFLLVTTDWSHHNIEHVWRLSAVVSRVGWGYH